MNSNVNSTSATKGVEINVIYLLETVLKKWWLLVVSATVMAAIGLAQLKRYDEMLNRRHELIKLYNEEFKDLPIQVLNHCDKNHRSSGHLYFVRFIGKDDEYRNKFYNMMAEHGVMCNVHFKPLPMLSAYSKKGFRITDYPNAYNMHKNQLTLPLNTTLSDDDAWYVIETFKQCINTLK